MKQNEVQNSQKKKKIIKIDFKQLMNQLIIRIMNYKKNRLRQNSKFLKTESNFDSKSDTKNNSNSNSENQNSAKRKRRHISHTMKTKSAATVIKKITKSCIAE